MADTGYNWDTSWTEEFSGTLTQGGTTDDTSAAISLKGKAAVAISVDADYSNHAKATGGLFVHICRDINGGDFEVEADGPWSFEMPFTQAGTNRQTFVLDAMAFGPSFKIYLDWDNSTSSAAVTVVTNYKFATIPAASA
ncbi:MAG: hypothetical protein ABFE01_01815 [Phycisphaerales bacterium]